MSTVAQIIAIGYIVALAVVMTWLGLIYYRVVRGARFPDGVVTVSTTVVTVGVFFFAIVAQVLWIAIRALFL